MDCITATYNKCSLCDKLYTCKHGQIAVKNHQCPDRDPDALTNDFIYCRGEWDSLQKMSKLEVRTYSSAYNVKISQIRKELGLE